MNSNRVPTDIFFLQQALLNARQGTCIRKLVGCVLVDAHKGTIGGGYNGVARGRLHCNEGKVAFAKYRKAGHTSAGELVEVPVLSSEYVAFPNACKGHEEKLDENRGNCDAIHAEENALLVCKDIHSIVTCYCTASPCFGCTKLLLNTSCERIVFIEKYEKHHDMSMALWVGAGREWFQIPDVTL